MMKRVTPALALKDLVASIRRLNQPKTRVFDAVSELLFSNSEGIRGTDSYFLVGDLFRKTEIQIENLNIEDSSKNKMNSDLAKVKSCFEIPGVAAPLESIIKDRLTQSSEDALEYIHIAIVQSQYFEFDAKEAEDLAKEFKDALKLVEASNMPSEISELISRRLKQTIHACEHFSRWGPEGLDAAISALTGEVIIQKIKIGNEDEASIFKQILSKIPRALEFANKASNNLETFDKLLEKGKSFFESITNSGGS